MGKQVTRDFPLLLLTVLKRIVASESRRRRCGVTPSKDGAQSDGVGSARDYPGKCLRKGFYLAERANKLHEASRVQAH